MMKALLNEIKDRRIWRVLVVYPSVTFGCLYLELAAWGDW
jgi:hypothetical protein